MATLADALRQAGYAQDGTLGTPAPVNSPMTTALAEHIKSIPQKFNENQQHQMDLLARAYPGNTFKSMMLEGDPAAMNELAMQAPIVGMMAYHGTPHKILDKFDINKVGTGEGAQAYGHGMYFAENPAVAKEYANELGSKIDVNGKPLYVANRTVGTTGNTELDDYLVANVGDVKATRKQLLNDIKEIRPTNPEAAKEMQKTLADLRKTDVGVQNTGNLYKVDIPDEHIPMMLEWDKPIAQMSPEMQKEIRRIAKEEYLPLEYQNSKKHGDLTGKHFYHQLVKLFDTQEGASKVLNSEGIKGIRYLDEGSRAKGGTSNFVVFDPSTVKILEENSKPVSRKALIEEQVKKLKD